MKGSIIQPLFFPWAGYFHLICRSEIFIFLDDVQFKKTWCARNQILINGKKTFINMPLIKQSQKSLIKERRFINFQNDYANFKKKIFYSLKVNDFFSNIEELFSDINEDEISKNLSDFNIFFIKKICNLMDIKTSFHKSSEFNIKKKRSEKLIELCKINDIKQYLSPVGSKNYMSEDKFEVLFNGKIQFNKFFYKEYNQNFNNKFIDFLSILDLISNMSWKQSFNYIYCHEVQY
ncbi:WbqC family protein [Candidatus Pelagibacter sp.]|nr:WbqC family protein [Candidatus Pelagibacter sp.]